MFWRGIVEEMLWFINGSTDSSVLSKKGIKIWNAHGSKKHLSRIGLGHRDEGDLGPVYGFQMRHWGASVSSSFFFFFASVEFYQF